jgi:hypothetical protein
MTISMNIKQLTEKLRQPVPYQWRVQSRNKDKTKAFCSAYIDARDVMRVLDENCEYGWEVQYKEIGGFIFAGIGINVLQNDGADSYLTTIYKWDCGQRVEDNPQDQMYDQAGKSAASDAFKRAAVMWGIGRFLYDLEMITLPCDQYGNVVDNNGSRVWDLTKHINSAKSTTTSTYTGRTDVTTAKPPSTPTSGLPALDQEKYDAMVKFITEGKIKEVESAIKKYSLNDSQKKLLTALINQAKSEAVTKAAKK